MPSQVVEFPIPIKGKSDGRAYSQQAELTSVDCLNFLAYDRQYRARGGQRPGTTAYKNIAGIVYRMLQVSTGSGYGRTTSLISVGGNDVYSGTSIQTMNGHVVGGTQTQAAAGRGYIFFTNGTLWVLHSGSVAAATPSAGSTPTGVTLCCMYRDRLVVGGPDQNWYMSRTAVYDDWDYGQTDISRAVSGNASDSTVPGAIGDPLVALIPWRNDVMLMAGDQRIWMMQGDPGDGGGIALVSNGVGILGPNAWAHDPDGALWLLCSGGLHRFEGSGLVPIDNTELNSYFVTVNRGNSYVSMAWDRDRHGLWIFITPIASSAATHIFYDVRQNGFFPQQFPVGHGPVSSFVFDGDAPADRAILLGGRDGIIRKLDDTATTDTGSTISSYVYLGPIQPSGPQEQTLFTEFKFVLGEIPAGFLVANWNTDYTIQVGTDGYDAFATPDQTRSGSFLTAGVQAKLGHRLAGNTCYIKIANGSSGAFWSLERVNCMATPGGIVR